MQSLGDYYRERMTPSPDRQHGDSKPYRQISPKYSLQRASRASTKNMMNGNDNYEGNSNAAFSSQKPSVRRTTGRQQTGPENDYFNETYPRNDWVLGNSNSDSKNGANFGNVNGNSPSGRHAPPNSPRFNAESSHNGLFSRSSDSSSWRNGFHEMSRGQPRDRSRSPYDRSRSPYGRSMNGQGMMNVDGQGMYMNEMNNNSNWDNVGRKINSSSHPNFEGNWMSTAMKPSLRSSLSPSRPRSSPPKISFQTQSTYDSKYRDDIQNPAYGRISPDRPRVSSDALYDEEATNSVMATNKSNSRSPSPRMNRLAIDADVEEVPGGWNHRMAGGKSLRGSQSSPNVLGAMQAISNQWTLEFGNDGSVRSLSPGGGQNTMRYNDGTYNTSNSPNSSRRIMENGFDNGVTRYNEMNRALALEYSLHNSNRNRESGGQQRSGQNYKNSNSYNDINSNAIIQKLQNEKKQLIAEFNREKSELYAMLEEYEKNQNSTNASRRSNSPSVSPSMLKKQSEVINNLRYENEQLQQELSRKNQSVNTARIDEGDILSLKTEIQQLTQQNEKLKDKLSSESMRSKSPQHQNDKRSGQGRESNGPVDNDAAMQVFDVSWEGRVRTSSLQTKLSQCAQSLEDARENLSMFRTKTFASTEEDFNEKMDEVTRNVSEDDLQSSFVRIHVTCSWGLSALSRSANNLPLQSPTSTKAASKTKNDHSKSQRDATTFNKPLQSTTLREKQREKQREKEQDNEDFTSSVPSSLVMTRHEIEELQCVAESNHPYNYEVDGYFNVIAKQQMKRKGSSISNSTGYNSYASKELSSSSSSNGQFCEIMFDAKCCTTNENDFIRIYKDASCTATWGEDYYGGPAEGNWPGIHGRPPLIIPSTKFVVYFHSAPQDGHSNMRHRWGFKLTAIACDSREYVAAVKAKSNGKNGIIVDSNSTISTKKSNRRDDWDADDVSIYHYTVNNYGVGSPTASTAVDASSPRKINVESPRRPRSPTFLSEKYSKDRRPSARSVNSPKPSAPKQIKSSSSLTKSGSRGSMARNSSFKSNNASSRNLLRSGRSLKSDDENSRSSSSRRSNGNNSNSSNSKRGGATDNEYNTSYSGEDSDIIVSRPLTPSNASRPTTPSRNGTPSSYKDRKQKSNSQKKYKREDGMILAPDGADNDGDWYSN